MPHASAFLSNLAIDDRSKLEQVLSVCANGREQAGDMAVISWASACTRPGYLAKVLDFGLHCSGAGLFGAGLSLMNAGWDMSQRIAQLKDESEDVDSLRAMLALQPSTRVREPDAAAAEAIAGSEGGTGIGNPDAEKFDLFENDDCPHLDEVHPSTTPIKQGRSETGRFQSSTSYPLATPSPVMPAGRLQVRLFGKDAAHTLEVGPHRRGADFLGVNVVTIESARALPASGYDWGRKLMLQLTPEEMPAAMAVFMGLVPATKFGQHGADRDKYMEIRHQEGGMVIVTGQSGVAYAVPVKSSAIYYVLDLFCSAMVQGRENRSIADVLALVRSVTPH